MKIREVLGLNKQFIIGMVHCLPLPGTLHDGGDVHSVYAQAVQDAKTLEAAGVDAVIVENMGDDPFMVKLEPAQFAALAVAKQKVRDAVSIPVGVDAAFCDFAASLAIAKATGAQFIRAAVFVDTVQFYGGTIYPCARECMMYRKALGCEDVMVLADVQVKHTDMVLPHVTVEQSAVNAAACGADAIIVTGSAIGIEPAIKTVERVKGLVKVPVIAGSGVNSGNIRTQLAIADGAIIGSAMKDSGKIANPISEKLARELMAALRG